MQYFFSPMQAFAKQISAVVVPRGKMFPRGSHFYFAIPYFGHRSHDEMLYNFPLITQARLAIRVASKVVGSNTINKFRRESATKRSPDRADGAIKLLAYLKYTVQTILVEKQVNPTNWLSSHSRFFGMGGLRRHVAHCRIPNVSRFARETSCLRVASCRIH